MLFGHQNSNDQPAENSNGVNPLAVDPASGASLPVAPEHHDNPTPVQPQATAPAEPTFFAPLSAPEPTPAPDPSPAPVVATSPSNATPVDDDLLELKQQALEQLSPLVSHLEQSPEEKFRTTMMMIQSSDNQELIKEAYAAAQQIVDDKARAQALLDIVNEINYFTQK